MINNAQNLTSRTNSRVGRSYVPESRVVLYGNAQELEESRKRLEVSGREVAVKSRADWDTGIGQCGQFLCHCNGNCKMQFDKDATI